MAVTNVLTSLGKANARGRTTSELRVAPLKISARPVRLAAAAHLAKSGEKFLVLESGTHVGNHILQWGHVRLFSPWQYNVDKVARELLEKSGWNAPSPDELPTGKELVEDYLEKIASLPEIQPHILLNSKVLSISKKGLDKMKSANRENVPFILYVDQNGITERIEAKAVIDATGTWGQPNPINADDVWIKEELSLQSNIYYGIPDINGKDREQYLGKRVAVIGGGHSAINTILELSQLNESNSNEIVWILRKNKIEEVYGGAENDALQARGKLGLKIHQLVNSGRVKVYTPFQVQKVF